MSYNISTWKTKKLESLELPIGEFFTHPDEDLHPEIEKDNENLVICAGECTIIGVEKDGILKITSMNVAREFSGMFYESVLKPALLKSTGELTVVTIWEGGDSILKLTAKDGLLEETSIDL